jgi:threonine synthase
VPAVQRTYAGQTVLILVATSGDTGKAALEGFANVDGVSIAVFYPEKGVSEMQRLQMATQSGENVAVFAVQGNFDSAQTQVKKIFTDACVVEKLRSRKVILSSANSINWGRLVPQIVYYFSAYADLLVNHALKPMQKINVVVPTGNFGNILAAYYAMRMGLPVAKLICASNRNNILTEFFESGVYDANRVFHTTLSPSMDILVSSNLERLLYEINDHNTAEINQLMEQLRTKNKYEITPLMHQRLEKLFWAGWMNDADCRQVIADIHKHFGYTADPHTAIAIGVHQCYRNQTGDNTPTVIASTASPFKFASTVLDSLQAEKSGDDFEQLRKLSTITGMPCPESLLSLREKPRRFNTVLAPSDMAGAVINMAGE